MRQLYAPSPATEIEPPPVDRSTRGILRPYAGLERFELSRAAPPEELTAFVTHFWTVRWNLPPGETFEQEILPAPCVQLAYESQKGAYEVHGPGTTRFVATLSGQGWVSGVRFTPAGFSAFSNLPMHQLVDRVVPASEVLGSPTPAMPRRPDEAQSLLAEYLRTQGATYTPAMRLVDHLVAKTLGDPSIVRADRLADEANMSLRSLHRLFERHVGVSTKWIVRRARVQEAAERVAQGQPVSWTAVAQELGYHDQAHLIRDFRAQVGETPAAYARRCRDQAAAAYLGGATKTSRTPL